VICDTPGLATSLRRSGLVQSHAAQAEAQQQLADAALSAEQAAGRQRGLEEELARTQAAAAAVAAELEEAREVACADSAAAEGRQADLERAVAEGEAAASQLRSELADSAREVASLREKHELELRSAQGDVALQQRAADERRAADAAALADLEAANRAAAATIEDFGAQLAQARHDAAQAAAEHATTQAQLERVEHELKADLEKRIAEKVTSHRCGMVVGGPFWLAFTEVAPLCAGGQAIEVSVQLAQLTLEEELRTECLKCEKLEELVDRMHAFQHEEIELSNESKRLVSHSLSGPRRTTAVLARVATTLGDDRIDHDNILS
jgi:hypothetical protein